MENIYNILNNYLRGSNKFGMNESIARFMLAYLDRIPQMKLTEIAARCHTSTPSVIRFCREMGYEDFTDFKQKAASYKKQFAVEDGDPYVPLQLLGCEDAFESSLENWMDRISEVGLRAMLDLDRIQLGRLTQDIVQYRYVYVFGMGLAGIVGEHLRIRLARGGKNIFSLATPQFDMSLTPCRTDTLSIVVSQHGRTFLQTPDLLPYLVKNSNKTWLITQEPRSRKFTGVETIYLQGDPDFLAVEYHILTYLSELIGEGCRQLLEQDQQ